MAHPESIFEDSKLEADHLHPVLVAWFDSLGPTPVDLRTTAGNSADLNQQEHFVYGARFLPQRLDIMLVEVWLTAEGHVAVGLEHLERVGRRVGVAVSVGPTRYAWGGQPNPDNASAVIPILQCAAEGRIALQVLRWPWGLGLTRAVVSERDLNRLWFAGVHTGLLPRRRSARRIFPPTILEYSPWQEGGATGAS